jgi:hypothetical protein
MAIGGANEGNVDKRIKTGDEERMVEVEQSNSMILSSVKSRNMDAVPLCKAT